MSELIDINDVVVAAGELLREFEALSDTPMVVRERDALRGAYNELVTCVEDEIEVPQEDLQWISDIIAFGLWEVGYYRLVAAEVVSE